MKETTKQLLNKAARAIAAAERELAVGDVECAVGRAYYAMFYVAEALLNEKGLRFKKHGGVHGAFGEHFTKTGALDAKFHRWLLAAFDKRITADYELEEALELDDAAEMIRQAQAFLNAAHTFLHQT